MTQLKNSPKKRYLMKIYGIVQGVGFRPFVYNTAVKYKILGWVNNSGGSVTIDLTGTVEDIKKFVLEVVKNPPVLAVINKVSCISLKYFDYDNFIIKESLKETNTIKFIPLDMGTCEDCVKDIRNKNGKRYRYPFTNCTKCGPRYSVIKELPYDRKNTTMNVFKMCNSCKDEYTNPSYRRFHAETNCCGVCGPSLKLMNNEGELQSCEDAIEETINLIKAGKIVAVKGLGGFHLVCSGRNESAIGKLRCRKKRPSKPLAVMMKDINTVRKFCMINKKEEQVLMSNKKPIVLLKKKPNIKLPKNIAPEQKKLGVMLPYTPIHYLLFDELDVLIMTSGNISGCPIEYKNNSALKKLKDTADYFLMHNREICVPIDDSVVKVFNDKECIVRRGRGYAPSSENINVTDNVIALGAQEKSSVSISKNSYVYTGQYLGDLQNLNCYENYKYVLKHLISLLDVQPKVWVCDMHPFYISNEYFNKITKIKVQHHHAHMVSCMAEHNISEKVIGVIYDGTGYGLDDNIWGGEFFIGTRAGFKRVGHFEYVNIQGMDAAIKEPWRCALSYLYFCGYNGKAIKNIDKTEIDIALQALKASLNCYKSSSLGRFFDAIAALIGLKNFITYDAEAAIALENILDENVREAYKYEIRNENGVFLIGVKKIILGVLHDMKLKMAKETISAKFHNTISKLTCDLVLKLSQIYGISKVVLSGGVFENEYLLKSIYDELKRQGLEIFFNSRTPINDGGISFGQIAAAQAIMNKGDEKSVSCSSGKNKSY